MTADDHWSFTVSMNQKTYTYYPEKYVLKTLEEIAATVTGMFVLWS